MFSKEAVAWVLSFVSALVLIMVIFLTVIEYRAFDLDFFEKEYQKLNNAQVIGISEQELMQTTKGLLAYIKGERDDLSIQANIKGQDRQVFNQKEIDHMVDVRLLYLTSNQYRNFGILVLLCLLLGVRLLTHQKYLHYWSGGFLAGGGALIGVLIVLALIISRDFRWFWDNFHLIIFTNDLWMLNPETDILIQMVPEQFFLDLVVSILLIFTGVIMALGLIAGLIIRKSKPRVIVRERM